MRTPLYYGQLRLSQTMVYNINSPLKSEQFYLSRNREVSLYIEFNTVESNYSEGPTGQKKLTTYTVNN